MIIALAGRRVDDINASQPRFPLQNVARVGAAVRGLLEQHGVTVVVSSAACGADLIALSEAGKLGLRRRIVLPFGRGKFRETSVVDRPGDWGKLFDTIVDEVEATGNLIVIDASTDDEPYSATNKAILERAIASGQERSEPVAATLVWDGVSRGENDYTDQFGSEARYRGLPVFEVPTL